MSQDDPQPSATRMVRGPDGRWMVEVATDASTPAAAVPPQEAPPRRRGRPASARADSAQLVRGPDGRWTLRGAEDPATTPPSAGPPPQPPPSAPAEPSARPGTAAPPTVPVETGPMVRRVAMRGPEGSPDRYVVVLGDSSQSDDQLLAELRRVVDTDDIRLGAHPITTGRMVEELGLRDGQVLGVGVDVDHDAQPPTSGLVLRVVGGPDAGRVFPVTDAKATIGRSDASTIRLQDTAVSRNHVVIQQTPDGVVLHDLGSENGTRVEGHPMDRARLEPGDLLRLGDSLLELGTATDAEVVMLEQGHGFTGVHRRFRAGVDPPPDKIRHPRKDKPADPQPLNLLMAILPAAGIGTMALVFGRPEMLIFAAMSPLLAIGRTVSSKKVFKEKTRQAEIDYAAAVTTFSGRLEAMRAHERRYRRRQVPDPARVIEAALHPTTDLWSRRATDPDALTVRVGSASGPSTIAVEDAPDGPDSAVPDSTDQPWLPVSVSLVEAGGLALVGQLDRLRPLACSLVLQLATLHAPSELRIVFLGGPDAEPSWSWLRWLPHLRRGRLEPSLMMGTDASSRAARVEELRRILAQRREESDGRSTVFLPRFIVVYDDASARLGEGVAEVLREGGQYGIHALALDSLQVPEGCNASVALGGRVDAARVEREGRPPVRNVITDALPPSRCEPVALRLASIQVIGEDEDDGLPSSSRLLNTIGLDPTAKAVAARWAANSPSGRAVIGVGPERPIALDLTRDGPHALVAGTTGAGKSEFIKTLVAALAIENHPDHLSFLFIDFKGGGDYQTLKHLPHAVALTTSLDDPAAFDRTLQLLDAEMARRIQMLQGAGTNSIEGYMATPDVLTAPMPRLVVVVDEFAELKDKAPQQLDRLVSVARTGRSVGVHLVLATQRPGGVVTSQIDANVGLRVCFRVKDEMESKEIIDSPLAGRIAERHRGRCFFRSAATPLTEVQTARVAGARPGAVSASPIRAIELSWEGLGRPLPKGRATGEVPDSDTDLFDVVAAATAAARDRGWTRNAIPWPRELPDRLHLADLPADDPPPDAIPMGLVDVPERQLQAVLHIAMGQGHVVVAGSGRTGRSSALRTFITGAVRRYSPADLHLAALDFGGGALLPVEQLPHCVGLSMEDLQQTEEIVEELERELARRRELFAVNGWPDLRAQRTQSDAPLPWLALVIDGWDNLAEEGMRQALTSRIAQLLARGTPQGLQVVMAGDRGTTHSQIARHLTHRYGLRFNRPVDAELQGIMARELPRHQPPGRAMEIQTKRLIHFAELDDPDGVGQGVAFQQALAAVSANAVAANQPTASLSSQRRGTSVDLDTLLAQPRPDDLGFPLLLGLGDEPRTPIWADLDQSGGTFFVAGAARTGRSTALLAMGQAADGVAVVVVGPDDSPLVLNRLPAWRRLPLDAPEDAFQPEPGGRMLVLVDDLDRLADSREVQQSLGTTVAGRGVVVAADIDWIKLKFSGLAAAVRRPRIGMVLSPGSTANGVEMFGSGLPHDMVKPPRPGRAVANLGAGPMVLQVPHS